MKLIILILSTFIAKSISDLNNTESDPNDDNSTSNISIDDELYSNDTQSSNETSEYLGNETYSLVGLGGPKRNERPSLRVRDNYYKVVLCVDYALRISKKYGYVCSAMSALMNFAKIRIGATGRTKSDLDKLLGSKQGLFDKVLDYFKNYLDMLKKIKNHVFFCSQIFIDEEFSLTGRANSTLVDTFGPYTIQSIRMSDAKDMAIQINTWVNAATSGRINSIVSEKEMDVGKKKGLIILSAIDFSAKWQIPFTTVRYDKFKGLLETTDCIMMSVYDTFNYYYSDQYKSQIIVLPFDTPQDKTNTWLKLIVVLPDTNDQLVELYKLLRINPDKIFDDIDKNIKPVKVHFSMPRINLTDIITFDDILTSNGFNHMFDDKCRRSGISDLVYGHELYVRTVKQKVHIDWNEHGAVGSSGSDARPLENGFEKEGSTQDSGMRCDHPFYFYIEAQGYIIMSGSVIGFDQANF